MHAQASRSGLASATQSSPRPFGVTSSCRRAREPEPVATTEASLSNISFSGTPPRRTRQPRSARRRSPTVRERVNVIARAAEKGRVVTRPNASRVRPRPTGTCVPVCHQSTWPISPGAYAALEGPGGQEPRTHPSQVVLQDRDPARVSGRAQALADNGCPHGRVLGQHRRAALPERVETGTGRNPDIPGRLAQGEQPVDGVAAHAEPEGDGGLGHPLAMEEPMNLLGPVLRLVHSFLPRHELIARPRVPVGPVRGAQVSTGEWCSVSGGVHRVLPGRTRNQTARSSSRTVRAVKHTTPGLSTFDSTDRDLDLVPRYWETLPPERATWGVAHSVGLRLAPNTWVACLPTGGREARWRIGSFADATSALSAWQANVHVDRPSGGMVPDPAALAPRRSTHR